MLTVHTMNPNKASSNKLKTQETPKWLLGTNHHSNHVDIDCKGQWVSYMSCAKEEFWAVLLLTGHIWWNTRLLKLKSVATRAPYSQTKKWQTTFCKHHVCLLGTILCPPLLATCRGAELCSEQKYNIIALWVRLAPL